MSATVTGFDFFLKQVKPELQVITEMWFGAVFDRYTIAIKALQPLLIQSARQQKDEKDKQPYMTALEQIQRFQPQMVNAFAFHLLESLQIMTGENTGQMNGAQVQNAFNALSQQGREDEIYLKTITEQCLNFNSEQLTLLRLSLQQSLSISIDYVTSPFNPVFICNALASSLRIQHVHSKIKREMLVLFDQHIFKDLHTAYQEILVQFQALGIRPNAHSKPDDLPDVLDVIDAGFNDLLMHGIVPAVLNSGVYIPMQSASNNLLGNKSLDQLLAGLQKGYDPYTDGLLINHLKDLISIDNSFGKSPAIALRDENIINLTGLLFRQIADSTDGRIGDLIMRLSVPYTRLILGDELFFHDKNHPARLMLSKLMQLLHNNPDDGLAYKQVQLYATKILMRFSGDNSIFNELSDDLSDRLAQYQQQPEHNLDHITRQLREEEKLQLIDKAISALINKQTSMISRKLRFHVLLDIFLHQIFTTLYRQHGKDSLEWKNAQHFLAALVPALDNRNQEAFATAGKKMAELVKMLNRYMHDCGISMEWRRSFFDQMQEIHLLLARGKQLKQIDEDDLKFTAAIDVIIDHYESERSAQLIEMAIIGHEHKKRRQAFAPEINEMEATEAIRQLNNGQWVNIMIDDRRTPCFLSHYASQRQRFIFCNRQLQKLFERSIDDMLQDFMSGFAQSLVKTDSFDRAFIHVISSVKKGN